MASTWLSWKRPAAFLEVEGTGRHCIIAHFSAFSHAASSQSFWVRMAEKRPARDDTGNGSDWSDVEEISETAFNKAKRKSRQSRARKKPYSFGVDPDPSKDGRKKKRLETDKGIDIFEKFRPKKESKYSNGSSTIAFPYNGWLYLRQFVTIALLAFRRCRPW